MKKQISGFFSGLLYFLAGLWLIDQAGLSESMIPNWALALGLALSFIAAKFYLEKD